MRTRIVKTCLLLVALAALVAVGRLAPVFPALRALAHPGVLVALAVLAGCVLWRRQRRSTGQRGGGAARALPVAALLLACAACSRAPTTPGPAATLADPAAAAGAQGSQAAPRQRLIPLPIPFPLPLPLPVGGGGSEEQLPFRNTGSDATYAGGLAILARDEASGDLGVAVIGTVPGAGGIYAAARAGAGAVLVGAKPDTSWKERGLELLAAGKEPQEVIDALVTARESEDGKRILAVLDARGRTAHYIGDTVLGKPQDSLVHGRGSAIAVACLVRGRYPCADDMLDAFDRSAGLPLPERLLLALDAGWHSKGFEPNVKPGSQIQPLPAVSAALLVVRERGGYDVRSDRLVDVRIDYSRDPLAKLRAAYGAWVEAVLGPRLRAMQRLLPTDTPLYRQNLEWLNRLRRGAGTGDQIGVK